VCYNRINGWKVNYRDNHHLRTKHFKEFQKCLEADVITAHRRAEEVEALTRRGLALHSTRKYRGKHHVKKSSFEDTGENAKKLKIFRFI
jgi:hypothetical protein